MIEKFKSIFCSVFLLFLLVGAQCSNDQTGQGLNPSRRPKISSKKTEGEPGKKDKSGKNSHPRSIYQFPHGVQIKEEGEDREMEEPNLKTCSFTYPQGNHGFFPEWLQAYRNQTQTRVPGLSFDPRIPAWKELLFNRYIELFNSNYAQSIAGSEVAIFETPLDRNSVLGAVLSDIHENLWEQTDATKYTYNSGYAYVDFANKYIGGGVLSKGLVQEEVEMLESNFLPFITLMRLSQLQALARNKDNYVPAPLPLFYPNEHNEWCKDASSLLKLDQVPVVLKLRIFAELGYYGWKDAPAAHTIGSETIERENRVQPNRYQSLSNPKDIFVIAMAAPNLSGKGDATYNGRPLPMQGGRHVYSEDLIEDMVVLATKGFYTALIVMDKVFRKNNVPKKANHTYNDLMIETGNWGAGAFKASNQTVAAIQTLAIQAAYQSYVNEMTKLGKDPYGAFLQYNAFDDAGMGFALEGNRFVWELTQKNPQQSVRNIIREIYIKTTQDANWQPKP